LPRPDTRTGSGKGDRPKKKKMSKLNRFLAILIEAFLLSAVATCSVAFPGRRGRPADKYYEAEVEDISGAKYFPAVKKALSEAKESIFLVMFVVRLRPYDRDSCVYQLMEELIGAHNRGVKVTVILDQNVGFAGREHVSEWRVEGENAWCFLPKKLTFLSAL